MTWPERLLIGYFFIMGIVSVFATIMAWRQKRAWAKEGLKPVTVLMRDEE